MTVSKSSQFYDFLHFKGCSYLNRKISFNLSVEVAIFLVFHNPFMMLFHILMSVSDHELMLDNFLLTASVRQLGLKGLESCLEIFSKCTANLSILAKSTMLISC